MRLMTIAAACCLLVACTAFPTGVAPSPSAISTPSSTRSPTPIPVSTRAPITGIPASAILSPDGMYLVALEPTAGVRLLRPDGTVVRQVAGFFGRPQWLPDSSGVFFEASAPQRAGPLGILELDGSVTYTELQIADPVLSRDGRTISAAHQEGCCASIVQREIHASARAGGPWRVLVRSLTPATLTQPIAMLGVARDGRILYRDGDRIALIGFDGRGAADVPVPSGLTASIFAEHRAPDGSAILRRTIDPITWWLYAGDALRPLPSDAEPVITLRRAALWVGGALLVRRGSGSLSVLDTTTLAVRTLPATLPTATTPIPTLPAVSPAVGVGQGRLLWLEGKQLRITDLESGKVEDGRLAVSDPEGVIAHALPAGGFLVLTQEGAYRLN